MEKKSVKYGLDLSGALAAIVFLSIELIMDIVAIAAFGKELSYDGVYSRSEISAFQKVLAIFIVVAVVEAILLILCAISCKGYEERYGKLHTHFGLNLTICIFLGVLLIFILIGLSILPIYSFSVLLVFELLLLLTALGLKIAALAIRPEAGKAAPAMERNFYRPAENPVYRPAEQTIEQKIAELKHLKELGAITEERYKEAVEALIQKIVR